jgi:peroxiredoxin
MPRLTALLAASALVLALAPSAQAAPASPLTHPVDYPASLGDSVPDFTLTDTAGKVHHLADYQQQGKIVVLEWFCPACSACEEYYAPAAGGLSRMEQIIASVAGPDTIWLSINSTAPAAAGGSPGDNAQAHAEWNMSAPLLLDPTGAVGHAFGADYTPTVYVIDRDGTLVYTGAPDDSGVGPAFPAVNFVGRAVAQLRAGQDVTVFLTEPFGCPVDYAQDSPPAAPGT